VPTRHNAAARAVIITISDTGKGMPRDVADKIFDPFFTTKKVGEGTGLGLTISYSIVEKLGGRIALRSTEGKGTTFTITLPVKSRV
jgi:two-component system NtrC family sensor kinase